MTAWVLLEGEQEPRKGHLLFTRGRAAKLGEDDLAAAASVQDDGSGQAIIQLENLASSPGGCPVGQGASVDFVDVGLIDLLRAHLRF